jgi:hypothetical protein
MRIKKESPKKGIAMRTPISIKLRIMNVDMRHRGRPEGRKVRPVNVTLDRDQWMRARRWAFERQMSLSRLVGVGLELAMHAETEPTDCRHRSA